MPKKYTCCGRQFKNAHGLSIHRANARAHAESAEVQEVADTLDHLAVTVSDVCEALGLPDYVAETERLKRALLETTAQRDDLLVERQELINTIDAVRTTVGPG